MSYFDVDVTHANEIPWAQKTLDMIFNEINHFNIDH